ncbi:MAG: hypothetical protein JKY33_00035 [Bacteroidia bacterium]|nr:hypothetical protein [Bacteroidia bacterium]
MDSLERIIKSLSKDDTQNLKKYIIRKSKTLERKDILLFNLIASEDTIPSKEIAEKIYGSYKKDAYHQLRKVLYTHIEDFVRQQNLENDETFLIMRYITLAKYMFSKNLSKIGWKYLLNAEEQAIKTEQFDLLNHIYYIQLEITYRQDAPEISEIIEKREDNLSLATGDSNLNIVLNRLRCDIRTSRNKPLPDLDQLIEKYLKKYNIKTKIYREPKLAFSIFLILAKPMMERKEYGSLELFLIKVFNELCEADAFKMHNHYHKLRILQVIINVKTKLRKFSEAEKFVEILKGELDKYGKKHANLILTFAPPIADLYNYQGKIKEAIEVLEDIMDNPPYALTEIENINYQVNLATLYFQNKDYLAAQFGFLMIKKLDKIFEKKLGHFRYLIKCLTDCIIHFEVGDNAYVSEKCKYIKRKFKVQLKSTEYSREKTFLDILTKLYKKPQIVGDEDFQDAVNSFIKLKEFDLGEIEVISFNDWLKSKIEKREYYEVMLESLN